MTKLHVLIVEDDPIILLTASEGFRDAGLLVEEAASADEALVLLTQRADEFHLVFSDIEMPGGLNGLDLVAAIHQTWPWLSVILTSGRIGHTSRDHPSDVPFFAKPYDIDQISTLGLAMALKAVGTGLGASCAPCRAEDLAR